MVFDRPDKMFLVIKWKKQEVKTSEHAQQLKPKQCIFPVFLSRISDLIISVYIV